MDIKDTLLRPVFKDNPITLQILGVCSALAVTSSLKVTLVMAIALTLVTAFSSFFISSIRHYIPSSIRGIDHHQLHRDGSRRSLCDEKPTDT